MKLSERMRSWPEYTTRTDKTLVGIEPRTVDQWADEAEALETELAEVVFEGVSHDEVDEIEALEQRVEGLDQIAEDALWHDGHDNPEALEDIRKTLKSLGYTQAAILAAAEEEA